jgi:hypothetical protein
MKPDPKHKEVTLEDFGLSEKELDTIVRGAQRFMPAREDDGTLADITPDNHLDIEPKRRTS